MLLAWSSFGSGYQSRRFTVGAFLNLADFSGRAKVFSESPASKNPSPLAPQSLPASHVSLRNLYSTLQNYIFRALTGIYKCQLQYST